MTPGEFLAGYAERSGTTPAALLEAGRVVVACSCGWALCEGWALIPGDTLAPGQQAVEL